MSTIHETTVIEVGPEAAAFVGRGLFVTFGPQAPQALRAYSYSVEVTPVQGTLKAGQVLHVGDQAYPITAVGQVAQQNLEKLGHVTVFLDGALKPNSQGAIHVSREGVDGPQLASGTRLTITD